MAKVIPSGKTGIKKIDETGKNETGFVSQEEVKKLADEQLKEHHLRS